MNTSKVYIIRFGQCLKQTSEYLIKLGKHILYGITKFGRQAGQFCVQNKQLLCCAGVAIGILALLLLYKYNREEIHEAWRSICLTLAGLFPLLKDALQKLFDYLYQKIREVLMITSTAAGAASGGKMGGLKGALLGALIGLVTSWVITN